MAEREYGGRRNWQRRVEGGWMVENGTGWLRGDADGAGVGGSVEWRG